MNIEVPSEAQEQTQVMKWAKLAEGKYPELKLLHHVPNGGSRNKIEAARLKQQGVKSGVPDLCLPVARHGFHGLYIEMKRREKGRVSTTQKQWIADLKEQGYKVEVCNGAEIAIIVLRDYLKNA